MAARHLLWVVVLLAGCASRPDPGVEFAAELARMLGGSYDNLAQARAGGAPMALRLVVAPVRAPRIGEHVFYVQEMAADDARRVLSQRLLVLRPSVEGERALLSTADLTEPVRWRDGHLNRELFLGMLPEDLRPRSGCDVLVTRSAAGFTGSGGTGCRIAAAGTGETLRVEQRLELDADGLALLELRRDAAGAAVQGGSPDSWYRFARRADAPW